MSPETNVTAKLTLEFPDRLASLLLGLAEDLGETSPDAVRRSVALMVTAVKAAKEGKRLVLVDDAEKTEREIDF